MSSPRVLPTAYCFVCYEETDAPRSRIWLSDLNVRISLCSDECLSKHLNTEKKFQKAKELAKKVSAKDYEKDNTQKGCVEDDIIVIDL